MLSTITNFFMSIFGKMNYVNILILMAIESSFIPFPSEIVIPPAAALASQGKLNIFLVILFGVLGSLAGAIFNYYFAYFLGRPVIYKFANSKLGKLLLLSEKSIKKSEEYFNKNGAISTLIGRLIPGVRQLISLPAGLAKMNIWNFLLFTFIGSLIWNSILGALGYFIGSNKELLVKYYKEISLILLIIGISTLSIILILKSKKQKNNSI